MPNHRRAECVTLYLSPWLLWWCTPIVSACPAVVHLQLHVFSFWYFCEASQCSSEIDSSSFTRKLSSSIQFCCTVKTHHLPINKSAQLKSDVRMMKYSFAEAFFFFFRQSSVTVNKMNPSKYSIKTSGHSSSFIILGLICNCRFVFCHFKAMRGWLRNNSFCQSWHR